MSKALQLADKLDRQLTMSMFAKREDLYAQMEQDREDASIAIKSLIAQLEAAKAELAAIRALKEREEPKAQPISDEQRAVLIECCNHAMAWTAVARIPEAGAFGEIAQDLDWLCDQLATTK